MTKYQIKQINNLLHSKNTWNGKICLVCGDLECHKFVYCKKCGNKFKYIYKDFLDYFKKAKNRIIKNRIQVNLIYFYELHRLRDLKGINKKEFLDYMKLKYKLEQKDFI